MEARKDLKKVRFFIIIKAKNVKVYTYSHGNKEFRVAHRILSSINTCEGKSCLAQNYYIQSVFVLQPFHVKIMKFRHLQIKLRNSKNSFQKKKILSSFKGLLRTTRTSDNKVE